MEVALVSGTQHTALSVLPCKLNPKADKLYCYTNLKSSLILCGVYYAFWIYVLPKHGKYQIRQEVLVLENGATTHKLLKVPNSEIEEWDAKHDVVGKQVATGTNFESGSDKEEGVVRQRVVDHKEV